MAGPFIEPELETKITALTRRLERLEDWQRRYPECLTVGSEIDEVEYELAGLEIAKLEVRS